MLWICEDTFNQVKTSSNQNRSVYSFFKLKYTNWKDTNTWKGKCLHHIYWNNKNSVKQNLMTWQHHSNPTEFISIIFQNCTRPPISIDDETIRLLERISLVDFCNVEGKLNLYCRVGEQYYMVLLVIWHNYIRLFKVYVD